MKLIYRIIIRLFLVLTTILAVWGTLFYLTIIDEINDEVDDSLEDYSENIIIRALAGQHQPSRPDGTNNSYYLTEVTKEYAQKEPNIRYTDEDIYIPEKEETEPARVLKTIFKNNKGQYFELIVSTPTIEKEDLQDAILNWIIILYFTLLFIILIINVWIFYRSMKPLYVLLKWLDQYTIGHHDFPPNLKTPITEFKKLHEAAVKSVKRNQVIFEQQKQFIGNASHELQTPLAICQNRLEMLCENDNMTEEQLIEISKIQETLAYIIRLNKSLLFLSKIENDQFQDNQDICLNELIQHQLANYQEIYSSKEIHSTIEDKGILHVNINETLATALITNLLKNAFVYNHPKGEINIILTNQQLTISNTGIAEALEEEKIFQRFYQGKNPGQGSSGLGLSIAKAICKIYHIDLRYFYASGKHHFELNF